jgi:hypothetical protein
VRGVAAVADDGSLRRVEQRMQHVRLRYRRPGQPSATSV